MKEILKVPNLLYRMIGSWLVSIAQVLSTQALEYSLQFYENIY